MTVKATPGDADDFVEHFDRFTFDFDRPPCNAPPMLPNTAVSINPARSLSPLSQRRLVGRFTDPRVVAFALGALLLIAVWATTAVIVRAAYESANQKAAATTRELVQTYEAHTLRALREIDHTLRTVKYSYELVGHTDALARLTARDLLPPAMLFEVSIANERGLIVASTHSRAAADVSQESFFRAALAQDELFIATPRRGNAENEWKLIFARRLDRPDGGFAGTVFIAADTAYFVSSYDTHALGALGLLALVGTDEIVRVQRIGDVVSSGQILDWAEVMAHADTIASADATAQLDGTARYLSSRQLSGFPLAVMVGLSRDEQLAVVARNTRAHIAIAALVSIILMSVVAALGRMSWKLAKIRLREQQSRLSAARESGMAEIATNVLHNVGNALNSVNVSATLVAESIKQSKVAGLTRAVALMREHEGRLGNFVDYDPRGKHLPAYLGQLADTLQADQKSCVEHLDALQDNVEHIKKIVMMQQMLAKPSAVKEEVDLIELMEASVQMNVDALGRHSVKIVRDFEQVPTLVLDKHGVLQILVNLITNAKHACTESRRLDRSITLRVRPGENGVELSIEDNGVGIPAENLTRIFQHGFTTRTSGHGFGLHSSALTARELGGSLQAHSAGPGLGALFTLTLPLDTARAKS